MALCFPQADSAFLLVVFFSKRTLVILRCYLGFSSHLTLPPAATVLSRARALLSVSPLISCFFFSWLPASCLAQRRVMELFLYTRWEWKRQRNPAGTIKDRKVEPTPISTGKQKFRKIGDPVLRQRCRNPCPLVSMALILVRLPYLPFSWKTGSTSGLPSEPPQPQFQE